MAGYKGHTVGAVVTAFLVWGGFYLVSNLLHLPQLQGILTTIQGQSLLIITVIAFALFPDIDTNSMAQDIYYAIFFIVDMALIVCKFYSIAAFFGLAALLPIIAKHRGWTHSKIACFFIPLVLLIIPMIIKDQLVFDGLPYYIAALAGYSSHLILDKKL